MTIGDAVARARTLARDNVSARYSDADVAQLLREAHERAFGATRLLTPEEEELIILDVAKAMSLRQPANLHSL